MHIIKRSTTSSRQSASLYSASQFASPTVGLVLKLNPHFHRILLVSDFQGTNPTKMLTSSPHLSDYLR